MKQRFWLFKRGNTFYFQDSETGEQKSLGTKSKAEATRLLEIKRQTYASPGFNQLILKTCLATQDSDFPKRTWQVVMDEMRKHGKEVTRARCERAINSRHFDPLRNKKLVDTVTEDFLRVLGCGKPSIHHYLRRLHNLALGLGWLPFPILAAKLWPKPKFKQKRAITMKEHQQILGAEMNAERNLFYQLLWEIGAGQSDAAALQADQIDWSARTLSFQRKKTGSWCHMVFGKALEEVLKQLPTEGPLFPKISQTSANDRAAEFYRRCKILGITGVSLHSYRYAWAERAKKAGYPERFAQQALGHDSKAVHRAYAKRAEAMLPSLEEYERSTSIRGVQI